MIYKKKIQKEITLVEIYECVYSHCDPIKKIKKEWILPKMIYGGAGTPLFSTLLLLVFTNLVPRSLFWIHNI